ncbi:MAG: HD domain-containing protein [Clostridia bacterium]|nr:HD domain-containing protein [Clostridia bacterium]
MEIKTINELVVGEVFQGFFIIKSVETKLTVNNNKYLYLTLGDKTGEINAKIWDCTEEHEEICSVNAVVKIQAEVTQWKEKMQLSIKRIRTAREEDGVSIEDLIAAAPYKPEDMYLEIENYIDKIQDQEIYRLVKTIFEEKKEKLMYFPAAQKNHHSIRSGLLYHILTMLKSGEKLCEIYTFLNTDLLFAGIILHDIAKVDEMDSNTLGIVSGYTKEGQLLGHIIQGVKLIDSTAKRIGVDEEKSLVLQHMILAHHNEPEFGSPKRPMFPEAEMLYHLDLIDARMYDMYNALEGVSPGDFSERIWILNNRKLYKFSKERDKLDFDFEDVSF